MKRSSIILLTVVVAVLALGGLGYALVLPGLSVARQEASPVEVTAATWLLHHSVPASAKAARNPLGAHPDPAAIMAGKDLFAQKCESCHAYDGGGKTELGAGEFPRPPMLHTVVPALSDGEIFYHIRNGIRNTAMPAWNMPDAEVWQLVAFLRNMAPVAPMTPQLIADRQEAAVRDAHY